MADSCRDWVATLNNASFKGFHFEVVSDRVTGGRRIVTHEYPGRESWDNEDLGRAKQTIEVNAYVHGDDADALANQLLKLCHGKGAGSLVLPSRGAVNARCLTCDRGFEEKSLGRISVRMTFVEESGGVGGLAPVSMLFGAVTQAAVNAVSVLRDGFTAAYNAMALPGIARAAAASTVVLAARGLRAASLPVPLDAEREPVLLHDLAVIERDAYAMAFAGRARDSVKPLSVATATARNANTMANRLAQAFVGFSAAASDRAELARALEPLAGFTGEPVTNLGLAPSVAAEKQLTGLIAGYVSALAAVKWTEAVALSPHATRDDAIAARSAVAHLLEARMEVAASEAELTALDGIRAAAVAYLTRAGVERARIRTLLLPGPYPALVVAHELYGDASRDSEIVALNGWDNPMLLPPECKVAAA